MKPITDPTPWQDRWRQLKLAHCAVPGYGTPGEFWSDRKNVQTVYMKGRERHREQTEHRLAAMQVSDGARVLDIGAGPGTYAIPLASRGCSVTVVEPSPIMREAMDEQLSRSPALDITVIPKRWEDVTIDEVGAPFNIVLASYSLTMVDIGSAVSKMRNCCEGWIHLFWFLTSPPWVRVNRDLWPLLHGGTYPGQPTADWLWQCLIEMGIYANLSVETKFPPPVFDSVEAAVSDYRVRLNCTTEAQVETVRNYFTQVLRRSDAGYVLDGETLGAHIWWQESPASATGGYVR